MLLTAQHVSALSVVAVMCFWDQSMNIGLFSALDLFKCTQEALWVCRVILNISHTVYCGLKHNFSYLIEQF